MPLGASKVGLMGAAAAGGGVRGIFFGGLSAGPPSVSINVIEYITIGTLGNGVDFGDMTGIVSYLAATGNGETDRAVEGGGFRVGAGANINIMEYVTVSTPGDSVDFGDLTQAPRQFAGTDNASDDRGVFGGGHISASGATTNVIEYITVSSAGNATDFGDATTSMQDNTATSNGTNERGMWMGGNRYIYPSGPPWGMVNTIDYITISSTGNATDFGDLTQAVTYSAACSNMTNERGIRFAGYVYPEVPNVTTVIDYVTISSTGNATDFGDVTAHVYGAQAVSNGTDERGLNVAGYPGGVNWNTVEYITINSTGNSADFGDLVVARANFAGTQNAG